MSTPPRSKKRPSSFVPRIVLRRAVATAIPACALTVGSTEGCIFGKSEDIVLAQVAFDAATDDVEIIALAQVGFDAAADAPDGSRDAAADAPDGARDAAADAPEGG